MVDVLAQEEKDREEEGKDDPIIRSMAEAKEGEDNGAHGVIGLSLLTEKKTGWLKKLGQVVKNWKTRYFVLRPDCLIYFKSESQDETQGVVYFDESCGVRRYDSNGSDGTLKHRIELQGRGRVMTLAAPTMEMADAWSEAIHGEITKHRPLVLRGFRKVRSLQAACMKLPQICGHKLTLPDHVLQSCEICGHKLTLPDHVLFNPVPCLLQPVHPRREARR